MAVYVVQCTRLHVVHGFITCHAHLAGTVSLLFSLVDQVTISFNDAATTTYEYPSEQCLLDELGPEAGDGDDDAPDLDAPSSTLKSTPGLGATGEAVMAEER